MTSPKKPNLAGVKALAAKRKEGKRKRVISFHRLCLTEQLINMSPPFLCFFDVVIVSFPLEQSASTKEKEKDTDPATEIAAFLESEAVGLTAEEAKKVADAAGT